MYAMATNAENAKATRDLLARAHSPQAVEIIYTEKIQHRKLHLRATSPPPSELNSRAARRRKRQAEKDKKKQKPAPLSAREKRRLGLHDIPREGQKYEIYEPLNKLWHGYINEVLGSDVYTGGPNTAAKLASAEFHGAIVKVVRSRCPGRVGIKGVVVRDRKHVLEIVTRKQGVKMVPKEGTTFRVEVQVPSKPTEGTSTESATKLPEATSDDKKPHQGNVFVFDLLGDQLMVRSADRATRKFKAHFQKEL
ncbi:Rof/RNase P-like protein [Emericellopsis atlantica]|uniref:Ribonuclease P protein subunit n=1 Tax=Emericellopsis atlantica TaxID=2614577 RepID=A0A9P7ZGV8_9HYPO|nr:Rof/RNase P-like protein [Emericellopsis atlantica]KAG9251884.1 Rof/RNase P-like protein [Emericellopsis atlantica]